MADFITKQDKLSSILNPGNSVSTHVIYKSPLVYLVSVEKEIAWCVYYTERNSCEDANSN